MLRRLVIALTALFALVGVTVVAGYVFVFAVGTDRLARAVPANHPLYATVYLQPSTGQKLNLATTLGNVPGFADAAGLDQKLHQISARFLGQVGIDYEADVRPWIGNQVALAARPGATLADPARWLLIVAVKDRGQADAALDRIAAGRDLTGTRASHEGVELTVADGVAWALLDELVIFAPDEPTLTAAVDAELGRAPSLAEDPFYVAAMRALPADHIAAAYANLDSIAESAGVSAQVEGYSTVSAALLIEPGGLHLHAIAPFDSDVAPAEGREAFALASEPSSLADWMPPTTQVSVVFFRLAQSFEAAEGALAGQPGAEQITSALSQLRALAAFGLGVNIDDDVLPLFDSEAAVALTGLTEATPSGQLLLRPADPEAAKAALDRMRQAILAHGGSAADRDANGTTLTTVDIPGVASLAWAVSEDVIIAGLAYEDVAAALAARSGGATLAESERYRSAWELAGDRGGNEAFLDFGAIADASGNALGTTGDARDILLSIGAIGFTAPARADATEIHVVLTVR